MNFWVGLLIAVVVILVVAAASLFWVMRSVTTERVTPVTTLNADGATGKALAVHHPGLSDFTDRTMGSFVAGLAEAGWVVDQTTASAATPVNVAEYDLVVLGSPAYGTVAKPMADYIARVADFAGKPVVIMITGAGDTVTAITDAESQVAVRNGRVIGRLSYTTMRPNESPRSYTGSNTDRAIAMARDAGRELLLEPAP